ncbi:Alcohol dehydrogenase, class IV [Geosporobacter subterraneus DSM 17957]|uniref:Alcohol dehydrogenase, class IV n=1 Tax=Geosporobacter subterraneus DSM 17957 TaxID=1121919 RepID=A0A1M6LHD3_9FIRM|nr:1-propanol dehydrogenase PduQ [Geosporobacter subterraneus]SHJ70622.1 Alcohol dehydrogenase, class IV [Geosporobacter subterraneus DSM 17957]
MKKFVVRPEIYFGENSINYLRKINGKRAFIVTDPFMVKLGLVDKVTQLLDENRVAYEIFSEVEPDPSLQTVKKGLMCILKMKPDVMIAIGGGSSIDAAKAIMMLCIHTKEKFIDIENIKKPCFVAIPTTSGTGSEVTSYAVITDREKDLKIPLSEDLMMPDVALLDCALTKTVPPHVTADTGMDVLTHAIEAYASSLANDFTDIYAEKAIHHVFRYLLRAYKDGNDMEARQKLHSASCMAGIAFTNASLGINHSLAHTLGAKFHLSHGRSNAIFLPYVIRFNAGLGTINAVNHGVEQKYAALAKGLGLPASNIEEGIASLIEAVKFLNRQLVIPLTIAEANIANDVFEKHLLEMASNASADMCTINNPRRASKGDFVKILQEAYGK